jgi:hypothetical protein
VDAGFLARLVAEGRLPLEEAARTVADLAYHLPKRVFRLPPAPLARPLLPPAPLARPLLPPAPLARPLLPPAPLARPLEPA